jgi:hypothetical protein
VYAREVKTFKDIGDEGEVWYVLSVYYYPSVLIYKNAGSGKKALRRW